jgi:hypothetical protein
MASKITVAGVRQVRVSAHHGCCTMGRSIDSRNELVNSSISSANPTPYVERERAPRVQSRNQEEELPREYVAIFCFGISPRAEVLELFPWKVAC